MNRTDERSTLPALHAERAHRLADAAASAPSRRRVMSAASGPAAVAEAGGGPEKGSRRAALVAAIEHVRSLALEQAVADLIRSMTDAERILGDIEEYRARRRRELIALIRWLGGPP